MMLAMHVLHVTEEEFWVMTPKTLLSLLEKYNIWQGSESNAEEVAQKEAPVETTIDAVSWW